MQKSRSKKFRKTLWKTSVPECLPNAVARCRTETLLRTFSGTGTFPCEREIFKNSFFYRTCMNDYCTLCIKGYVFFKTVIDDVLLSVTLQPITIYLDDDRNFTFDVKYSVTVKEVGFCFLRLCLLFCDVNFPLLKTSKPKTGRFSMTFKLFELVLEMK